MESKAKILLLDIETAPNVVYVWSLWKPIIPVDQIISTSRVLCWSARWQDKSKIISGAEWLPGGQKKMLKDMYNLLHECQMVVHYNGKAFDIPKLNKDFLMHGFTPPAPYKQVDLIETSRKKFAFLSNSLKHIASELRLREQKRTHRGFKLWVKCMEGDKQAQKEMLEYNRGDVKTLAELYQKFLPWIDAHPNVAAYTGEDGCPRCGSVNYRPADDVLAVVKKYPGYTCNSCGYHFRDAAPCDAVLRVKRCVR